MASIGEFGPSSAEASRATSAATSLMRSRSKRILHPLGRPAFLGLALHTGELAGEPVALRAGAVEVDPQLGIFRLELLGQQAGAVADLGNDRAKVGFDLARGFELALQLPVLEFTLGQKARLVAQPVFQIL